jgi:hypothetical protein
MSQTIYWSVNNSVASMSVCSKRCEAIFNFGSFYLNPALHERYLRVQKKSLTKNAGYRTQYNLHVSAH